MRLGMRALQGDQDGVWPDNVGAVAAFIAAETQWRVTSISGGMLPGRLFYLGLSYAGARVGIEAAGIELTPDIWSGVRVMEAAAREALNGISG